MLCIFDIHEMPSKPDEMDLLIIALERRGFNLEDLMMDVYDSGEKDDHDFDHEFCEKMCERVEDFILDGDTLIFDSHPMCYC